MLVFSRLFVHDIHMTFTDLGVSENISKALGGQGIQEPTEVQAAVLPDALARRNLFVESETGTGKTLAFLIPVMQGCRSDRKSCQALILSPTRELASQTHRVFERLARDSGIALNSALLLGGASPQRQLDDLQSKPQIIIGTPGRVLQFSHSGKVRLDAIEYLVLDEADRLFSPEALEETTELLSILPAAACAWLFSATLDESTMAKAQERFSAAQRVRIESRRVISGDIEHWALLADKRRKVDAVRRFDVAVKPERALLFVHDSGEALNALMRLGEAGIPVQAIHGDFDSQKRLEAVDDFRSGKARWLITSDVAARGLDIDGISHVVMLDAPRDYSGYVHRAGRTGRNGKKGICASFADSGELKYLSRIAVHFGFSFKTKRLHSGDIYDVTLDEFFAESNKMLDSFRSRRKKRPGSNDGRP
jgi:superfamily II DNA/RNA helicase